MARGSGDNSGARVMRGIGFAVAVVAVLVLLIAFWSPISNTTISLVSFIYHQYSSGNTGQKIVVGTYLGLAAFLGLASHWIGRWKSLGFGLGLGILLWFLLWEGFPPFGLSSDWLTSRLQVTQLPLSQVFLWAGVSAAVLLLFFAPSEAWEVARNRRRS